MIAVPVITTELLGKPALPWHIPGRGWLVTLQAPGTSPEPIREHFVVISGRRWPPKQVLALVTGLDRG